MVAMIRFLITPATDGHSLRPYLVSKRVPRISATSHSETETLCLSPISDFILHKAPPCGNQGREGPTLTFFFFPKLVDFALGLATLQTPRIFRLHLLEHHFNSHLHMMRKKKDDPSFLRYCSHWPFLKDVHIHNQPTKTARDMQMPGPLKSA